MSQIPLDAFLRAVKKIGDHWTLLHLYRIKLEWTPSIDVAIKDEIRFIPRWHHNIETMAGLEFSQMIRSNPQKAKQAIFTLCWHGWGVTLQTIRAVLNDEEQREFAIKLVQTPYLSQELGNYIAKLACEYGETEVIEQLVERKEYNPALIKEDDVLVAVRNNHLEIIKVMNSAQCDLVHERTLYIAAGCGHIEMLDYLISTVFRDRYYPSGMYAAAAKNNQLAVIKHLHEKTKEPHWDYQTLVNAASSGYADIIIYALQHGCNGVEKAIVAAADSGQLECLMILCNCPSRTKDYTDALIKAIKERHFECIKYLVENWHPYIYKLEYKIHIAATSNNDVHILKYLRSKGFCNYYNSPVLAAQSDANYDIVTYLGETGTTFDSEFMLTAAKHNSIKCMKYAFGRGCKLPERTVNYAAMNASYECMIFAIENGCPYNGWKALKKLAKSLKCDGKEKCFEYLINEGFNVKKTLYQDFIS